MTFPKYTAVTAVQSRQGGFNYSVSVHGNDHPIVLDLVADQLKKQAGTYEYLEMEHYVEQEEMTLHIVPCREPGTYEARIDHDTCVRDPKHLHNLLGASARGTTPAQARRNLARKISGHQLLKNSALPIATTHQVPVFSDVTPMDDPALDLHLLDRTIAVLRKVKATQELYAELHPGQNINMFRMEILGEGLPTSSSDLDQGLQTSMLQYTNSAAGIAGWTRVAAGNISRQPREHTQETAQRYLGLEPKTATQLFNAPEVENKTSITVDHAIAALEILRDTGQVRWEAVVEPTEKEET